MSRKFVKQYAGQGATADPVYGITFDWGTTVPTDATAGYAPGCIFMDVDGSAGQNLYVNVGTLASCDFNLVSGTDLATLTATATELNIMDGVTATTAELNYLDQNLATNILTRGTGVDTAESYSGSIWRSGGLIITRIIMDISVLVGSTTDLDIIGESAAANCNWGQITTAKSGTLIGGLMTCLEVPAGGVTDIDLYSSNVETGTENVIITDAALGTETALVTSGGAWTSGASKGMTSLPTANDYLYLVNGAAGVPGTFTAGKFMIELFGV